MQLENFKSIGFHSLLILNRLANKRQLEQIESKDEEDGGSPADRGEDNAGKKNSKADIDYVTRRLKEISEWEKKLRKGITPRRL